MAKQKESFWFTPKGLAALGLIAAASYFLLTEHRQHAWQFLPYIILLACPFMHIFMHSVHGQHKDKSVQDAYQRGLKQGRNENEQHHH